MIKLRQYLSADARIYNLYGPAECSITTTCHLVTQVNLQTNLVPIGFPLPNYKCYILDEYSSLVPVNTLGELYIGGPGVFTGYLETSDTIRTLNQKVLVSLAAYGEEGLFYRTGDLCRLSNNGEIIYVGRIDHQVKIRGQRLELGEVEATLVDPDITACAVIKQVDEATKDEYLAAYLQAAHHVSSTEYEKIQTRILTLCKQKLPAFMIPTAWLILQKLPLNSSDKIDRNQLPKIDRTNITTNNLPATPTTTEETSIEQQLRDIFSRALNREIDANQRDVPFGQLGGTSLTAMSIITLIRDGLYRSMDVALLFEYPTVQQLASKLAELQTPSQGQHIDQASDVPPANDTVIDLEPSKEQDVEEDSPHPSPSLIIEIIGVIGLVLHYLYPSWIALRIIQLIPMQNFLFNKNPSATYRDYLKASAIGYSILFSLAPAIQLCIYLICKWLLIGRTKPGEYRLYSRHYYCHWLVHRLWIINSSQLSNLVGTPLYNLYLRMCGARIGWNVHINTTLIDTPDLLSIEDNTYISNHVTLASLSYARRTYKLNRIRIGSDCSVQTRSVLQHGVRMGNNVLIKPMTHASGEIPADSTIDGTTSYINNRPPAESLKERLSFNALQMAYQILCIFLLYTLRIIVPLILYATYLYLFPRAALIYFALCLPIVYIASLVFKITAITLILLIIIGSVRDNHPYNVNSWSYVHKLWFRQLVVNQIGSSYSVLGAYHRLYPIILRWFGAHLGSSVDIADFTMLLCSPSKLITAENNLTTNGACLVVPVDVVDGQCTLRRIAFGDGVTLGNIVTVEGGAQIPDRCLVGGLSRIDAETHNSIMIVLS